MPQAKPGTDNDVQQVLSGLRKHNIFIWDLRYKANVGIIDGKPVAIDYGGEIQK